MSHIKFQVRIEQNEVGVFVAEVPALPGCISPGQTRDDALSNAEEAIENHGLAQLINKVKDEERLTGEDAYNYYKELKS